MDLGSVFHPTGRVVDVLNVHHGNRKICAFGPRFNHGSSLLGCPRVVGFPAGLSRPNGHHNLSATCMLGRCFDQAGMAEVKRLEATEDHAAFHGLTHLKYDSTSTSLRSSPKSRKQAIMRLHPSTISSTGVMPMEPTRNILPLRWS